MAKRAVLWQALLLTMMLPGRLSLLSQRSVTYRRLAFARFANSISDSDLFSEPEPTPLPYANGAGAPPLGADATTALDSFYGDRLGFPSLGISEGLANMLAAEGKAHSTMIQARAIPPILEGEDLVVAAETGSGKTLSYVLPLLQRLANTRHDDGEGNPFADISFLSELKETGNSESSYPRVLVLAPNKELVQQILVMSAPLAAEVGEVGG